MRIPEYLSPSSISVFDENLDEYYMRYMADERPPRDLQTQPMAIGSAFDAYVKAYLHEKLFGKGNDPRYELDALIDAQVEEHHRDWAREHGRYVFNQYTQCGTLADLMLELQRAKSDPRFEFEVRGAVSGFREGITSTIADVTLLGKPDVHFINHAGCTIILDFKVNGYCSTRAQSPMGGYVKLRSGGRTNHGQHKDCQPMLWNGTIINIARYLEDYNRSWAQQLAIYAWLTGEPVGSEFIVAIDQLSCSPNPNGLPIIKVAEHRTRVSVDYQKRRFNRAAEIWDIVHSDHIFRDRSKELSQQHCAALDRRSLELRGEGAPHDVWFSNNTRPR